MDTLFYASRGQGPVASRTEPRRDRSTRRDLRAAIGRLIAENEALRRKLTLAEAAVRPPSSAADEPDA
jgi:hypothetical protein